ncbi:MAG: hypothetical protein HY298_14965 [Verrucomicrobia bacterium]|nr:hypothetical protein [Verrucomicrobiota bacterium]
MKRKLKTVLVLPFFVLIALGLIFAYLQMSKERAAEAEREKPVAAESKVTRDASGETIVTVDEETQKRIALQIAALAAAELQPEVKGYGRVLDPAPVAALVNELVAAHFAAQASGKEFERLKLLADQNNASARALEAAEATARRDQLQMQSLRTKLALTWGKALAEGDDLPGFAQSLATHENALVRIDLPAGESLPSPPLSARIVSLAEESKPVTAEFFDVAPAVNAQTQGQGFLFLVKSNQFRFAPGAAVLGYLRIAGQAQSGAVIPRNAVVRFNGKPWVYFQSGNQTFTRREISEDQPLAEGWFAAQGMKAGDRVVVQGAQMLLSEEQKYQIHMGD